ncbi:MAG TPA: sodium:proton antiporter [Ktedonobacteraceae bacterium]|nr:sodium:proton antiporter [Ktedonobacteraceae bacterium]
MTDVASVVRLLIVLLLIALVVILLARRLAIPYTLGLVVVGLLLSLVVNLPVSHLTPDLVLFVFLPALLFEGSWSISVTRLRTYWLSIFLLAVPGLLLGLVLIALPLHYFAHLIWLDAFLLAAILSPTDPVAVLGLFKQLRVDERLATIIEGESLFNDGVAGALYQVFLGLLILAIQQQPITFGVMLTRGVGTFVLVSGGGIVLGAICGFFISRFVKHIDEPLIEITITIIAAYGTYLLADYLGCSGILAVIVAGLILGSYGRSHGMSSATVESVDNFWSLIAFLANALIFLLVGAQLNPIALFKSHEAVPLLLIAGLVILAVLIARAVIVFLLPQYIPPFHGLRLRAWRFMIFWSGLRGALSLALVLALPLQIPAREELIFATYAVVFFTLIGQGFSIRGILKGLPALKRKPSA